MALPSGKAAFLRLSVFPSVFLETLYRAAVCQFVHSVMWSVV